MRCAVLGDPIAHSLSPVLHRAGYAELGLDWRYEAVRVPSGGLAAFLDSLDGADEGDETWRGLSLTMPLKREVLDLVEARTALVELTGVANTVVLGGGPEQSRLDNTDLPGAAAAIRERYAAPLETVSVLGGGATAASVALAACELGAATVRLLVRDPQRARPTAEAVRRHPSGPTVEVLDLASAPVEADLLVSTLPADAQSPDLLARCGGVPAVFEVVYDPWPTPLAARAVADGQVLIGGLDLLVHQAVLQLLAFTGLPVPVGVLREAGQAALTARRAAP